MKHTLVLLLLAMVILAPTTSVEETRSGPILKSGELKMESIKLSDMKVYVYGDAAVVIGSSAQAGNFKGQAVAPKIMFTDTFIKQKGKWKAEASHRSAVE